MGNKHKWFSGLRAKITLVILLACLPPLLVALYSIHELSGLAQQRAERDAARMVRRLASEEQRGVVAARQVLLALANTPELAQQDDDSCRTLLAAMQRPFFSNLMVLSPTGVVRCSVAAEVVGQNLVTAPFFTHALQSGDFSAVEYAVDPASRESLAHIGYADFSEDGVLRQVLVATLAAGWLKDLAEGEQLPDGAVLLALNGTNRVIHAHGGIAAWQGKDVSGSALAAVIHAAEHSSAGRGVEVVPGLDGVERLYAFRRLDVLRDGVDDASLHLALGLPLSEAFGGVDRIYKQYLTAILLSLALLLLLGWWGSERLILRKVRRLTQAARQVAQGDYSVQINDLGGGDEVTALACHFNEMSAALSGQQQAIVESLRVRELLQQINRAIVHIQDEQQLLDTVCCIAVEQGGFHFAWIGRVDWDSRTLRPRAVAGDSSDVVLKGAFSIDDDAVASLGVVATAIATRRYQADEGAIPEPLRSPAMDDEQMSIIALPLVYEGEVQHILMLAAQEAFLLGEQEQAVLTELAEDVALGLAYSRAALQTDFLLRHDMATGLLNRDAFTQQLQHELTVSDQGHHFAVLIALRVNGLARIGELYGAHAVDRLKVHVARGLQAIVGKDALLGRVNGDEFGVLQGALEGRQDAAYLTDRIVEELSVAVHIGPDRVATTVSLGAALYPQDHTNPDELLALAELALRKQPDSGENACQYYSPEFSAEILEWRKIEQSLPRALEDRELTQVYQPVVGARDGRVVGVEALLRWHSRSLGVVAPDRFIPVAERSGAIMAIGEWLLDRACMQLASWQASGEDVHMAVNMSVKQLLAPGFADGVLEMAQRHGGDALLNRLCLEVTEHQLITHMGKVSRELQRLRERGVQVYVDDFGTGYSSLSYLKDLPFDVLKIDRKFIEGMLDNDADSMMVRTIINLAQGLDKRVVAEGVETQEQLERLQGLGCDWIQGYVFAKPARAQEAESLFNRALL